MKLLSVFTLVVSYLVTMFSLIHFEVPQGDEGDHKVSEGLEDEHIEVKKKVWFHVLANIDV